MYVKNQIYFHFHRNNEYASLWTPGNKINFTNKQINSFNAFYSKITRTMEVNGAIYKPLEAIEQMKTLTFDSPSDAIKTILEHFGYIAQDYAIYLRESVFEEVRREYFPGLPSRKTCIWVCSQESLEYWRTVLGEDSKLLKLQLTGVIHKADQRHLHAEILPESIIRENAFNYWTGSDGKNPIEEELLFEGIVKVLEVN